MHAIQLPSAVTVLVSYKDEAGKSYVLLGRSDPRYTDLEGRILHGERLPPSNWKFVGGNVEEDVAALGADDPQLEGYWPDYVPSSIAPNAMKELGEEANLSREICDTVPALQGLLKRAKLKFLYDEAVTSPYVGKKQVYYLNLDLGTLSPAQMEGLQQVVQPKDDMLQTILAPADTLLSNEVDATGRTTMRLKRTDGHCRTKEDFNGFDELETWLTYHDPSTEQGRFHRECILWMHHNLRGLDGIDTSSLYTEQPLGLYGHPGQQCHDIPCNELILRRHFDEAAEHDGRLHHPPPQEISLRTAQA